MLWVRLAAWAFVLLVVVSGVAIPGRRSVTTVLSAWLPAVAYTSCLVLGVVALSLKR
jgi:hypothetical protein